MDQRENFELKFDPKTIEHLGVKMYSTLPPALSELISNAYDADASGVQVKLHEQNGKPISIKVIDTGTGMSSDDLQEKFLVIGRNRREKDGDDPSPKFKRLPTGKKGLGKLALFGLAEIITVDTVKDGMRNRIELNWNDLLTADGKYNPNAEIIDTKTDKADGTVISLSKLKRKSPFDLESLADSISRIFIVDTNFRITLSTTDGKEAVVTNERKYSQIETEFEWQKENTKGITSSEFYDKINFHLITTKTPIPPNSGLRGITIFSRGKLVNSPEFFSNSTSSHFFQYLTGWVSADFIDLLEEDIISTNRQSINWDNDKAIEFRNFLSELINSVNKDWRALRKKKKDDNFVKTTGVDKERWFATLPIQVKESAQKIFDTLSNDEGISENFAPVVEALHAIIPEYPSLHWRHLHKKLQHRVEKYYQQEQYGEAADQATKIYAEIIRGLSDTTKDGVNLASEFGFKWDLSALPTIEIANLKTESGKNIQQGQEQMTRGVMTGFRNPINHQPLDSVIPGTFTELDCLNILSLISYLTTRLDNSKINKP